MNSSWKTAAEEEDGDGDEDESEFKSYDDHIMFLIDSQQDMFNYNSKGEILMVNILKILLAVLKSKIISSNKSCVGAIFFGTVSVLKIS